MNAIVKGWCPTLAAPMPSGDGWLARVKPRALSAAQARALADAAARHGNGVIEITSRAGLQLRGLTPDSATRFAAELAGLDDLGRVIAAPLAGCDPGVSRHATGVADALARLPFADLPAKFGFAVDGGGVLPLGGVPADIAVVLRGETCHVALDGASLATSCTPDAAPGAVLRLSRAFAALAGGARRMRDVVAARGAQAVFDAAGLPGVAFAARRPPAATLGWLPYGDRRGAFVAGFAFGSGDAATLRVLADLAERHGDGRLRPTPWRGVALAGVSDPAPLRAALMALDLIVAADDPRALVFACPGLPACASATVPTRAVAATLAGSWPGPLHVSGCAKGCAHPGPALTLVGAAGRFDLVRQGRAGDAPDIAGLHVTDLMARTKLPLPQGEGALIA